MPLPLVPAVPVTDGVAAIPTATPATRSYSDAVMPLRKFLPTAPVEQQTTKMDGSVPAAGLAAVVSKIVL